MYKRAGIVTVAVLAAGATLVEWGPPVRPAHANSSPAGKVDAGRIAGSPPGLDGPFGGCAALSRDEDTTQCNGYRLQFDSEGHIASYTPLLGGALLFGRAWPEGYGDTALPPYMVAHYGLGQTRHWRQADRVVYQIDPETRAIIGIAALLTGDRFTVGQPAPPGYDVYNIPLAHRAQWADSEEALYRYADGRIYRIEPATRLVTAAMDVPAIPGAGF